MNGKKARALRKLVKESEGHFTGNSTQYVRNKDSKEIRVKFYSPRWAYRKAKQDTRLKMGGPEYKFSRKRNSPRKVKCLAGCGTKIRNSHITCSPCFKKQPDIAQQVIRENHRSTYLEWCYENGIDPKSWGQAA